MYVELVSKCMLMYVELVSNIELFSTLETLSEMLKLKIPQSKAIEIYNLRREFLEAFKAKLDRYSRQIV